MYAFVQLALIEKSKRIFTSGDDTFLSFPLLAPWSCRLGDLSRLAAPGSAEDYARAADFARIVNFVPRDMVAGGAGEEALWDVYADVMARAEPALGLADPAAEVSAAAARALLYEEDADGTRRESVAYTHYRRYRDAWIAAREDYAPQRLTGEAATDPEERRRWAQEREPSLRAALDLAEQAWREAGGKDEVEAALAIWRRDAANDPQRRWDEWRSGFDPDLDLLTDPWGSRFAPTAFAPRDLESNDAWLHFEMSGPEMASLVAQAPPELAVLRDGGGPEIERVAFDYRSVAVVRPWFQPEALTSRFWRAPAGADFDALSDGADPPSGRCPAFVSALIFVRRVQITARDRRQPETSGPLVFTLPPEKLTTRMLQPQRVAPSVPPIPPAAFSERLRQRLRDRSFEVMRPDVSFLGGLRPEDVHARALTPVTRLSRTLRFERLDTAALRAIRGTGLAADPPATPEPTSPPPLPEDEVSILAFVCKRIPRAPDPLPGLRWA